LLFHKKIPLRRRKKIHVRGCCGHADNTRAGRAVSFACRGPTHPPAVERTSPKAVRSVSHTL